VPKGSCKTVDAGMQAPAETTFVKVKLGTESSVACVPLKLPEQLAGVTESMAWSYFAAGINNCLVREQATYKRVNGGTLPMPALYLLGAFSIFSGVVIFTAASLYTTSESGSSGGVAGAGAGLLLFAAGGMLVEGIKLYQTHCMERARADTLNLLWVLGGRTLRVDNPHLQLDITWEGPHRLLIIRGLSTVRARRIGEPMQLPGER